MTIPMSRCRDRRHYATLVPLIVAAGLASRLYAHHLPPLLQKNAGDALWALLVFVLVLVAAPRLSVWRSAAIALAISCVDEFSQLYHAPWIDGLRATTPGGLLLGHEFVASDLLCYTIGIAIGCGLDLLISGVAGTLQRSGNRRQSEVKYGI